MSNTEKKRILAVDDQDVNIEIYELLLRDSYCLEIARCGEEALEIAPRFKPDLVLLDIMMPGINGYETCRRLRSDPKLKFAKIVLVSAESIITDRLMGYEAGADDYIIKPFDADEFMAKVEVFLRLKFAEEVNQFKTEVLNLLCHETRTPLNMLIAPAEILLSEEEMEPEKRREWAQMILDGTERLQRLFEKVVLLSQCKAGRIDVSGEPVDLVRLLDRKVDELRPKADAKELEISVQSPRAVAVSADPDYLAIVLDSILDNAVRFSNDTGQIEVELTDCTDGTQLIVTDHGAGIDEDQLPYVFDEFNDRDVLHHTEGHGLSLALSRAIVDQLGGEIQASSTPGVETSFTVRLPRKKSPGPSGA